MKPSSLSRIQLGLSEDLVKLERERFRAISFGLPQPWLAAIYGWLATVINPRYWHGPAEWITVGEVPYVDASCVIAKGQFAMPLWRSSNGQTVQPLEHWAVWYGGLPHTADGIPLTSLLGPNPASYGGVSVFSQKPEPPYVDHHEKLSVYVSWIESHAQEKADVSSRKKAT